MSETMMSHRADEDTTRDDADALPLRNQEKHIAKASIKHPPRVPTIEEFNNNYPHLAPELMALVVQPDTQRVSQDGITMLDELMTNASDWVLDKEYVGKTDEEIENALVRRIQVKYNQALDSRAIGAAKGIARDAVRTMLYGPPEVADTKIVGVPLRDDVPSTVAFKSSNGVRYKLLTPEERKRYGIHTITIDESQLSKEALEKIFTSNKTEQGE